MSVIELSDWHTAAVQALRAYSFEPETVSLQALNLTNNINFKVHHRSKHGEVQAFVLRIQRRSDTSAAMLGSELAWLEAIRAATELRVPSPLRTEDGALFGAITPADRQQRLFTLFHWLDGRFVTTSEQDAQAAAQVGALIGQLHRHAQSFVPESGFTRRRLDAERIADWKAIDAAHQAGLFSAQHVALFERVQQRTRQVLSSLDQRSATFGLIHADLIWKNYFFHDRGAGALDFEDCAWGYYLYDLAPTLVGFFDEPHYPALRAGLIAGYRRCCRLPAGDEAMLDTLMAARHVVSCCWLARRLDDPALRSRAPEIVAYRSNAIRLLLG